MGYDPEDCWAVLPQEIHSPDLNVAAHSHEMPANTSPPTTHLSVLALARKHHCIYQVPLYTISIVPLLVFSANNIHKKDEDTIASDKEEQDCIENNSPVRNSRAGEGKPTIRWCFTSCIGAR